MVDGSILMQANELFVKVYGPLWNNINKRPLYVCIEEYDALVSMWMPNQTAKSAMRNQGAGLNSL